MIFVKLTNGFGNNLFQYVAARLLSEYHDKGLVLIPPEKDYYGIDELRELDLIFDDIVLKVENNDFIEVNDNNYMLFFNRSTFEGPLLLNGYFEDYRYYVDHIEQIKSWFPIISTREDNDLVLHFRGGDRLMHLNEFHTKPIINDYIQAIKQFDYNNLHIVTDMPKWDYLTEGELASMQFHIDVPPSNRVSIQLSVDYFNSFIDKLSYFNPIIYHGRVYEDFNYIRSFNNILMQHSTLCWWAAVLSCADKVGVYKPWRSWKAKTNVNLSQINLNTWFQWE